MNGTMQMLGIIVDGHWRLGIGDHNVIGWSTVAAYLIAAWLCGAYARRADRISPVVRFRWHRSFWWSLAAVMLLMGINKQLDLQNWLTAVGRQLARTQGWHDQRRTIQIWFVAGIASISLILLTWLGWAFRRDWRQHGLALFGIVSLVTFVMVRAASFHHVDEFLSWRPAGVKFRWMLEIGGIACVGTSALIGILRCAKQAAGATNS